MATVLKVERGKRNDEYAQLRVRIFERYHTLALIGAVAGRDEHRLPIKLGHWHDRHSDLVRAVHESLWPIVRRIDELRAQRDPDKIKAQHVWGRRGDNFRRKGSGKPQVQVNPGEWPPRYK